MTLFSTSSWPLWCACSLMLAAAVINARSLTVPNRFSLGSAAAGLMAAVIVTVSATPHGGSILSSAAAMVAGFVLLIPFYAAGWLGAGCVKMQAAFGAWVGCGLGLPVSLVATGASTLAGGVLTALAALMVMLSRRLRAQQHGPPPGLFPAQVTLSLGSIAGLLVADWIGWY